MTIRNRVMESLHGLTVESISENGSMENNMDLEHTTHQNPKLRKESGKTEKE
jgi:hypothetical protein